MAMCVETISASLAAGILIAAVAMTFYFGHCVWFAVDCL
jgi:hypothetical protein